MQDKNWHVYGEHFPFILILSLLILHTHVIFFSAWSLVLVFFKIIALKMLNWFFLSTEIILFLYTTAIENHYKDIQTAFLIILMLSQLSIITFKYIPLLIGVRWEKLYVFYILSANVCVFQHALTCIFPSR